MVNLQSDITLLEATKAKNRAIISGKFDEKYGRKSDIAAGESDS